MYVYIQLMDGTSKQQYLSFNPLHCVSWDFHPMFIWILSLISKK